VGQNEQSHVPLKTLLQRSSLPKKNQFKNTYEHGYNLRSAKPNLILQHIYSNATEEETAQYLFNPQLNVNHIYNEEGKEKPLKRCFLDNNQIYGKSLSNDWGRLAQGNDFWVKGTNTIQFIHKTKVSHDKR